MSKAKRPRKAIASLFGEVAPVSPQLAPSVLENRGRDKYSEGLGKSPAGPGAPGGPGVSKRPIGELASVETVKTGPKRKGESLVAHRNTGATGATGATTLNSFPSTLELKTKEGPPGRPRTGPGLAPLAPVAHVAECPTDPNGGPEADPFGFDWPRMAIEHREALDMAVRDLLPSNRSGLPDVRIDFDLAGVPLRLVTGRAQIAGARLDGRHPITPAEAVTVAAALDPAPLSSARALGAGLAKAKAAKRAWRRNMPEPSSGADWWPGAEGFCGAQLMRRGPTVARLLWKLGGELVAVEVESAGVMPSFGEI